ncbi:DUF6531 domain-containing protein [Burkholderia sp. AU31624]|uniref:RHS repeat-associated core domain-containing protein n=1 Tax=Burkholderia sp. AU31624 TaxID=2879629 RepID=UPI001CF31F0E|nr:RHS repeat-associated core domain-containing protein [Burkholderia sp. AU31624]MCA8257285.1 DUF6531 domain-containing protein [Burkholderia sp. AU31624]
MALLAVKHLDPVVGVDVHSVLVTPGTPPVFLPHPHVGFMLDKREYIQAAKAVVGCIATMIAQEKVTEYIEHHPEDVKKLEHLADEADQEVNNQLNNLMGGGKLPDFKDDPTVAEGMRLAKEANKIKSRISDDLGSNVGSGGSSGRPIFVNGMMRATAGTHAYHVPGLHFPLGESFAPPPEEVEPSNDGESFMGSKTVLANNDPMSYMALEALSCWSIGMEPPPHNSAHTDRTYPSMPSSVMLPIPAGRPVLVGGPPIMNMAAAAKGLFKAFRGSKWAKALADKLHLKPGFLRCNVLKAEPVDATTGQVVVQQVDFTVSGRLPLVWERHYASANSYDGAVGAGWQTPMDIRLELMPYERAIGAAAHFPDHSTAFDRLPDSEGWSSRVYDWQYGYALYQQGSTLKLRTREGIEYAFAFPLLRPASALESNARLTLLIERIGDLSGNAWVFERNSLVCIRIAEWAKDGPTERAVECSVRVETSIKHSDHLRAGAWLTGLTLLDRDGHVHPLTTYEQDHARDLRAAVDAMAQPHRFDYTADHRMISHTSARGISFFYSYCVCSDGIWRVARAWGDEGLFDYRFSYDTKQRETTITDSRGYTTILQLDRHGLPLAEIDPLGGVTSYQYDVQRRTSAQTAPSGDATRWDYDAYGDLVTQILPDGSMIRTEYDADRRPVRVTSIGGQLWRYEWDGHGNLLTQIAPSGTTSLYEYDQYGQLVKHIGPRDTITCFEHDRDGNPSAVTNALGHRTQYRYDARGNLVETIDPLGRQGAYSYDRNGNLTRAIEPGGRETHCTYDADGNLIRYRDPVGNVTQIDYSALSEITKRCAPDGTTVEYRYDTENQLIGVVNERGELYTLQRDELGRIIVETDYWGQARRYRYGPDGELLDYTTPSGQTIEYRYDQLGRIVQKRTRGDEGVRVDDFEYDRKGNLVRAENPSCRIELRYDEDGHVIEERQDDIFTIASDYDSAGNRTARRTRLVAGRRVFEHLVRYSFDAIGAAMSIQIDGATPVLFERDALGRVRVEQLGANLRRELSYDPSGQLASHRTLLTDTGVLFASEYAYDANGELIERRDSGFSVERFQYDPVGRVTSHVDPSGRLHRFLHNPAGDLLTMDIHKLHPTNATDAMGDDTWVREAEYDGCNFTYDRSGNLIHKQDSGQSLTLYWNAAGQLVETATIRSTVVASGEISSQIHAKYEYDAFNRRIRKVVRRRAEADGLHGHVSLISHFLWDGNALTGEYSVENDSQPCFAREWVHLPETFQPLAVVQCDLTETQASSQPTRQLTDAREALYFYQNDPNGAPTRMHGICGEIIWSGRHNPTGKFDSFDFDIAQPLRLTGQYHDQETGLHYNRHRYFDPDFGEFISQDPLGLLAGTNPYQYSPNVFGWQDPLGLNASCIEARLTDRLAKWKAYKAAGGNMSMAQWVQHTRSQSWGHRAGGGYGSWYRSITSTHGNSLAATGPHDLYAIREVGTKRVLHIGETGRGYMTRFGEHQAYFAKLGIDVYPEWLRTVEGKAAAKSLETELILAHTKYFYFPPYNKGEH